MYEELAAELAASLQNQPVEAVTAEDLKAPLAELGAILEIPSEEILPLAKPE